MLKLFILKEKLKLFLLTVLVYTVITTVTVGFIFLIGTQAGCTTVYIKCPRESMSQIHRGP